MSKKTVALGACLFISALTLSAGAVTQVLPTVVDTSPSVGGSIVLPQFNNSLGTLTGVTLTFGTGDVTAAVAITDFEPTGGPINLIRFMGYQVNFDIPVLGPYNAGNAQDFTCSAPSIPENNICSNSATLDSGPLSHTFDLSSQIAALTVGTVSIPYLPEVFDLPAAGSSPAAPANLSHSVTNEQLVMPVSVTYTYTSPVPEPSSVVLAGIGFGIGILSMKLRAKR